MTSPIRESRAPQVSDRTESRNTDAWPAALYNSPAEPLAIEDPSVGLEAGTECVDMNVCPNHPLWMQAVGANLDKRRAPTRVPSPMPVEDIYDMHMMIDEPVSKTTLARCWREDW